MTLLSNPHNLTIHIDPPSWYDTTPLSHHSPLLSASSKFDAYDVAFHDDLDIVTPVRHMMHHSSSTSSFDSMTDESEPVTRISDSSFHPESEMHLFENDEALMMLDLASPAPQSSGVLQSKVSCVETHTLNTATTTTQQKTLGGRSTSAATAEATIATIATSATPAACPAPQTTAKKTTKKQKQSSSKKVVSVARDVDLNRVWSYDFSTAGSNSNATSVQLSIETKNRNATYQQSVPSCMFCSLKYELIMSASGEGIKHLTERHKDIVMCRITVVNSKNENEEVLWKEAGILRGDVLVNVNQTSDERLETKCKVQFAKTSNEFKKNMDGFKWRVQFFLASEMKKQESLQVPLFQAYSSTFQVRARKPRQEKAGSDVDKENTVAPAPAVAASSKKRKRSEAEFDCDLGTTTAKEHDIVHKNLIEIQNYILAMDDGSAREELIEHCARFAKRLRTSNSASADLL